MHVHIFWEMSISQVQYAPLVCVCGCVYVCGCKKRTYIPLLNLHLSFVGHGVKRQAGRSTVATNVWEKTVCSDNERACGHGRGGIQIYIGLYTRETSTSGAHARREHGH